jgi:cobalt-zinc-cadmium efflux system outer membrane protein
MILIGLFQPRALWLPAVLWLSWMTASHTASAEAVPAPKITMPAAIQAALVHYPDLDSAQAAIDEAQAVLMQAQAWLNPQIELQTGHIRARRPDVYPGAVQAVALSQPLEWPAAREARKQAAQQGIISAEALLLEAQANLAHEVKLAYLHGLRTDQVLVIATENYDLLLSVHERVLAMHKAGEVARYELVKAAAEAQVALRQQEAARHQRDAARALLANLTGQPGVAPEPLHIPLPDSLELTALQQAMQTHNPLYTRAKAQVAGARAGVTEARADRLGAPSLKAGIEHAPDSQTLMLGVAIPIPLFNQGQGQVARAEARLSRAMAEGQMALFRLERELEQGFHRYRGAQAQLQAFDSGLLAQASDTLRVAETAYRAGERGILDVLDASRSLRAVRLEQIQALFDTYAALFELERLSASDLTRVNPS